jgi:predicted ester cyclase
MSHISNTKMEKSGDDNVVAPYDMDCNIVDFILGITYEIWEQRQVEKILDYYSENVEVFGLDGITSGAALMVKQTYNTLAAFPDRLLLGDDVIASGTARDGFSSHRITSPMTNLGDTVFGPATGREVQTMNIADCEIHNGRITREWLVRDNLALVEQLGFDPMTAARQMSNRVDPRLETWLREQFVKTMNAESSVQLKDTVSGENSPASFAHQVLESCWITGDRKTLNSEYAPYCVMQRAPSRIFSGRERVLDHYAAWRRTFPEASLVVENICSQRFNENSQDIAVRWSLAGMHKGEFAGVAPSGKPVYMFGVTHWKVVDSRIAAEWTVFDELAMLAQTIDDDG